MLVYCACFSSSAELVGYVTLRLLKPMCRTEQGWCEEDQLSATKRVISIIHSQTVPVNILGTSSTESSETELLSAPAFAFCFPLLRCVLREGGKVAKADEDLRQEALQVVAEHCKLRASDNDDDDEEVEEEEDEHNEVNGMIREGIQICFIWPLLFSIFFYELVSACDQSTVKGISNWSWVQE